MAGHIARLRIDFINVIWANIDNYRYFPYKTTAKYEVDSMKYLHFCLIKIDQLIKKLSYFLHLK